MENETFIGGFASGFLAKSLTHVGYGLYFTTSRVLGIDLGKNGGSALAGTMAGLIHGQLMPILSPEESAKTIADLQGMKDFEYTKDQIGKIELAKPGMLGTGHFVIHPTAGGNVKISLRHRIAYDRLLQLTQKFAPEKVQ